MTVQEFLDDARAAAQHLTPQGGSKPYDQLMIETTHIWDNGICKGYVIDALRRSGCQREEIERILHYLHLSFDEISQDEAEQIYEQF